MSTLTTFESLTIEARHDPRCFGIADWQTQYRMRPTPEQIALVGTFPSIDAKLDSPCPFHPGKRVYETHLAFDILIPGLTIMELRKLNPNTREPRFRNYGEKAGYPNADFANRVTLKRRRYLLLKEIVPNSENRTFEEKVAMLPKGYEVPSAVAETEKDLLTFLKTGKHPNRNHLACTSSLAYRPRIGMPRLHVLVGDCGVNGVVISIGEDVRRPHIGVGASWKFETSL